MGIVLVINTCAWWILSVLLLLRMMIIAVCALSSPTTSLAAHAPRIIFGKAVMALCHAQDKYN